MDVISLLSVVVMVLVFDLNLNCYFYLYIYSSICLFVYDGVTNEDKTIW